MADIQSEPSFNPAAQSSPAIAFEYVIKNLMKDLKVCIPAIVSSYNRSTNIVTVQPAISEQTETGEFMNSVQIQVPMLQLSGGGFVISFPIKNGDTGWLLTCDKDISLFKQSKQVANPNTNRIHSLEDSFFIPDNISGANPINDTDFVIQQIGGGTIISLSENGVNITAEKINIIGATTINGDLIVNGSITASDEVTGNGKQLSTHTHGGVEVGSGSTGAPE